MSEPVSIFVRGVGAVSPAGWGVPSLMAATGAERPLAVKDFSRPGSDHPLRARQVPALVPRPAFLAHPRLRRSSPISHYAAAAAIEAVGGNPAAVAGRRLGLVFCTVAGPMNYSRRFFDEALRDPATASPLLFPETVFNAPASHLAALLGITGMAYTLMGDSGVFLEGLALAARWIVEGQVEECLVVGAEEYDWLTADAFHHFQRGFIMSEGAGALLLSANLADRAAVGLAAVTEPQNYSRGVCAAKAIRLVAQELAPWTQPDAVLCDSTQGLPRLDRAEQRAWEGWPGGRYRPKVALGEGLAAATAWQCVVAVESLRLGNVQAVVSVAGCNQQAIGAAFHRQPSPA